MEDKILNNSYNAVEYGTEGLRGAPISISPFVSDQYEDSTTEDMEALHTRRSLNNTLFDLYRDSEFFEKYGQEATKIERCDIGNIYYYFKDKLLDVGGYNIVQIFCAIAEFFELNYKTLYNDIISLEDKANILDTLATDNGMKSEFEKSKRLF